MVSFLRDCGIALEVLGILAVAGGVAYLKLKFYTGIFSFSKKSDVQTLFPPRDSK
jgi:hypothetical protein